MEVNNEIMEIVSFEKRTFEEMAAKLDYFVQRMDDLCRQHGEKKAERWMDSHAVCRKLRISPRTLQTLRDNGTLAFTKIEWVCKFHSNFDRLLASFEKLFSQRRPPVYGDELLTDKEVSHLLKVSRRTLQDYRSNGILPYIQVGGKILYRASDIERTLMDGYREAYRSRK